MKYYRLNEGGISKLTTANFPQDAKLAASENDSSQEIKLIPSKEIKLSPSYISTKNTAKNTVTLASESTLSSVSPSTSTEPANAVSVTLKESQLLQPKAEFHHQLPDSVEAASLNGDGNSHSHLKESTAEETERSKRHSSDFLRTKSKKRLSKAEQFVLLELPDDIPTQWEFDEWVEENCELVWEYRRSDLYRDLCRDKWHLWKRGKWERIHKWQKLVVCLNMKMEKDKNTK